MGKHNDLGNYTEILSADFLTEKGYLILHRNYRFSRFEIDIIATKEKTLHFIEVKSLSSDEVANPEIHVTAKKFQSLKKAACDFLSKNPKYKQVQFDVLSVVMRKNEQPEFFLIEDVYL